jgi:predicted dehydrogenase
MCKSCHQIKTRFIEKPISNTIEEAEEIITLANEYNVKGQVGHVERFNPAFIATKKT